MKKVHLLQSRRVAQLLILAAALDVGSAMSQDKPAVDASSKAGDSWNLKAEREHRFKDDVNAFISEDREHGPPMGGIVFVGSSTIRFWATLGEEFSNLPIVRRGFGGARMADVAEYCDSLVTPYKPKMVVVYGGDNDLNEGATAQDVYASFVKFVNGVRAKLPHARIAFVSIKPSPSRPKIMEATKVANAMVQQYVQTTPNMDYINTFDAMLDEDGLPRREYFGPDNLHMNRKGYALWKDVVAPHIEAAKTDAPPPADPKPGEIAPSAVSR